MLYFSYWNANIYLKNHATLKHSFLLSLGKQTAIYIIISNNNCTLDTNSSSIWFAQNSRADPKLGICARTDMEVFFFSHSYLPYPYLCQVCVFLWFFDVWWCIIRIFVSFLLYSVIQWYLYTYKILFFPCLKITCFSFPLWFPPYLHHSLS
jgi:hypothetical protein